MNGGRMNLKLKLKRCRSIAQVVSVRDSNQVEILDAKGDNSSGLFKPKKRRANRSCNILIMGLFLGLALTQQERRRRGRMNLKQVASGHDFKLNRCQSIVQQERRRRRPRGRDMSEFPLDLMIEILIRLPPKYLARFKCVSKQWSSLISSRYFCDCLFTVTRRKQPGLYMCLVDDDGQRALLSISSTSQDFTCLVVDQDLSIPGMGGFFLNGLHGVMCFSVRGKACIYNPSTGQSLTLPKIKPGIIYEQGQWRHHTRYYIGHDPVNDQYKVLCTICKSLDYLVNLKSEHWVFVLEAGGSWKKVVPHEKYHHHAPFQLGRSISGSVVHYLAWFDNYTCAVVSFDFRSEEITTIIAPEDVRYYVSIPFFEMRADLIEYGGKLAIFEHSNLKEGGLAKLWVLEDVGKQEWLKKSLVLQPCLRHLVHNTELIVKGTTPDGKVILASLEVHSGFYLLFYDLQRNDLRKVEIKGVPHIWFDKECYFDLRLMDESQSVIYLET